MKMMIWKRILLIFLVSVTLMAIAWSAVAQQCPTGCQCLSEERAKALFGDNNYEKCVSTPCGYDANKNPLYCFRAKSTCPTGCRCLTEVQAKEMGYSRLCQDQRVQCGKDASGNPKYCFQVPVNDCPDGCVCLGKDDAVAEGLTDNCKDARGNPIVCGVIDAEHGVFKYCFKKPVSTRCHFDYALGKCVGVCTPGMKCILNRVIRDPKSGKIVSAECQCKAVKV